MPKQESSARGVSASPPLTTNINKVATQEPKQVDKGKEFEKYVRQELEKERKLARYRGQMKAGAIMAGVGIVITLFGYLTTPSGGVYTIFWGLIVVGMLFFINGSTALLIHRKKPKAR